ncbi:Aspartate 1-decarboxylase [uncultured archaeon]|nr:Aspartate 1-decarboxylase [uncultured archaeon]
MFVSVLKSKVHGATVTGRNLDYEGSITVDEGLMDAAGFFTHEKVLVSDLTSGSRFETYVIPGKKGSGVVVVNGAAAHLVKDKDRVIIMSFALASLDEAKTIKPKVIRVDAKNKPI